eukprot:8380251-Karenia_brevis.AAC.1
MQMLLIGSELGHKVVFDNDDKAGVQAKIKAAMSLRDVGRALEAAIHRHSDEPVTIPRALGDRVQCFLDTLAHTFQ